MRTTKELFDLTGKAALVTGDSRRLGLQIAEALGEQGAKLVLSSRKQADLDEAVAHLKARGIEASAIAADLSQESAVQPAALLFASDASKHITGQILAVDGGVSAVH